jgi:hypothetical protein
MTTQARPSELIMGFDTHMILEPCLHCPMTRHIGHEDINRTSRHYAEVLRQQAPELRAILI